MCLLSYISYLFYLGSTDINHASEDWTDAVDRGGLVHVSDSLYSFVLSMETEMRSFLSTATLKEDGVIKDAASTYLNKSEDVLFYWSTLAANWEADEAASLLQIIIDHWVTTRGFSHVSALMENYKKKINKGVQKSKGIRKNLLQTSNI